jgi:hypothetical protein
MGEVWMKQALGWLHLIILEVGCISDKSGVTWCHLSMCLSLRALFCNVPTAPPHKGACQPLRRQRGSMLDVHLSLLRLAHLCHILRSRPVYLPTLSLFPDRQSCILRRYINWNIYKLFYNDPVKGKMARAYHKFEGFEKRIQKKTYVWK